MVLFAIPLCHLLFWSTPAVSMNGSAKDLYKSSLETFEVNLMRESTPVRELCVWVAIGLAADALCDCDDERDRRKVVLDLTLASLGGKRDDNDAEFEIAKREYETVVSDWNGQPYADILKLIPE